MNGYFSEHLPLFIYDIANNHQGDLEHGLDIVKQVGKVNGTAGVNGAFKFQFRNIDTFVHPTHKDGSANKHIPRFISTRLSLEDYDRLVREVREGGMQTICTPFDEESVDHICQLGIEIIKIASCSAVDRPLLRKVAEARKPVVLSTAGLTLNEIDFAVSLFEEADLALALMHCVAIYPTPFDGLRLNQIDVLRNRFPDRPVGWSTHEDPDDTRPVQMAVAKGARLFERHVGLEARGHRLNKYSSTPEQLARWLQSYTEAAGACGGRERSPAPPEEIASLESLQRGVYARASLEMGKPISRDDVYFAMPLEDGQLGGGEWADGVEADADYARDAPLSNALAHHTMSDDELIFNILLQLKGMLNKARIPIGKNSEIEISHHYGLARFREFGAVIITCINRTYAKKLVIQLPRQKHPYHYHKIKEETFQLLHGDLEVELDGHRHTLKVGDTIVVEPGIWHKFHTLDGCIFEEVSTTHINEDSFYEDKSIAALTRQQRKTVVPNWQAELHHIHHP